MNWTLAIVAAALAALAIVHFTAPKPQRHHPYWCSIEVCATDGWQRVCTSEADHCSAFKGIQLDV